MAAEVLNTNGTEAPLDPSRGGLPGQSFANTKNVAKRFGIEMKEADWRELRQRARAQVISTSLMHRTKSSSILRIRPLRRAELPINTADLARYLIGKTLVHDTPAGRMSGRIVETEAYPPGDSSGHAFRGETPGNRSLFLGRGYAYVYFTYGSAFMMNVTSERLGIGAGVLIRALEPLEGIALMRRRRRTTRLLDLASGPGRLAAALQIDKRCDGTDLCAKGPLWLGAAVRRSGAIGRSVRIGITREVSRMRRFYERGNPFVSGPKWLSL